MPHTDINEFFFLLPPPPFSEFDFIASRTAHFAQFLTSFGGSPYLALPGVRLTVIGYNHEKNESSEKTERRPPTEGIVTFLIAYRQPPTLKAKVTKFLTISSNFENFRKFLTLFF